MELIRPLSCPHRQSYIAVLYPKASSLTPFEIMYSKFQVDRCIFKIYNPICEKKKYLVEIFTPIFKIYNPICEKKKHLVNIFTP